MALKRLHSLVLLASLLFLMAGRSSGDKDLLLAVAQDRPHVQGAITRRVNAPYFEGDVRLPETAILWFGRVTPTENSVDARVGYNDDHVYLRMAASDRRLWYDTSPSPGDLTDWDAVTLYLDLDGNAGSAPETNTYRFDAQLVWWEPRDDYQVAYRGNGSGWARATLPFTTTSFWRGTAPNNDEDDRAWSLKFLIPYQSLGLSGPPAEGAVWGMALALYDRDDASGRAIPDQIWPETMSPGQPATWGQLAFGMPTYVPPPAVPGGTVTVRHGLAGATVADADVGGSTVCGQSAAPDYFATWGGLNYAGKEYVNIQNLSDVGDWMCFSRTYVTFPLDALPPGKVLMSAKLTLVQFGNAGEGHDPGPYPSLIQVLTVAEEWNEATINWNNAPLAVENVAAAWADVFPELPGEPREWDVTGAAADAYASGGPLRLALYESDGAYHSGKYFWTSDVDQWSADLRPTLTLTWGRPVATLKKTAVPAFGTQGDSILYTLDLIGSGNALVLTDTLPAGTSAPGQFQLTGTDVTPTYDPDEHRLTWSDGPPLGQQVYVSYAVTIITDRRQVLVNVAEMDPAGGEPSAATAAVIANPYPAHQPLVFKGGWQAPGHPVCGAGGVACGDR